MTKAKKKVPVISLGDDFGEAIVKVNGAEIHVSADGTVVKPAPANDTAIAAAQVALGQQTADGVYAGLTADGKQQIYAMPTDLDVTMTFNDAAKAVRKLNRNKALGHDDWQIPSLENVRVLYKNKDKGALKGTFNTYGGNKGRGSDFPGWYWSSTEVRGHSSSVYSVRFSGCYEDGVYEDWDHKDDFRLSCRPVRLVPVASPALNKEY
jgi:hypothetical protein